MTQSLPRARTTTAPIFVFHSQAACCCTLSGQGGMEMQSTTRLERADHPDWQPLFARYQQRLVHLGELLVKGLHVGHPLVAAQVPAPAAGVEEPLALIPIILVPACRRRSLGRPTMMPPTTKVCKLGRPGIGIGAPQWSVGTPPRCREGQASDWRRRTRQTGPRTGPPCCSGPRCQPHAGSGLPTDGSPGGPSSAPRLAHPVLRDDLPQNGALSLGQRAAIKTA